MRFGNPHAAWLIICLAGIIVFYLQSERWRSSALDRLAPKELRDEIIPPATSRRALRTFIFLAALLFCILTAMRPQGAAFIEPEKRMGLDIMVALDTSRSMLTDDASPNRLAMAKSAIERFVAALRGDRIGLIAFAGTAFPVCPPTTDYSVFLQTLRDIDARAIPKGGTSLAGVLETAVRVARADRGRPRILLLVSDGEDHGGGTTEAARAARTKGLTVFTAMVGTPTGRVIPLEGSRKGFLEDRNGRVVSSKANGDILTEIALQTGGECISITAESSLADLYAKRLVRMEKREITGTTRQRYREWFQLPLAVACLLLVLEMVVKPRKEWR